MFRVGPWRASPLDPHVSCNATVRMQYRRVVAWRYNRIRRRGRYPARAEDLTRSGRATAPLCLRMRALIGSWAVAASAARTSATVAPADQRCAESPWLQTTALASRARSEPAYALATTRRQPADFAAPGLYLVIGIRLADRRLVLAASKTKRDPPPADFSDEAEGR